MVMMPTSQTAAHSDDHRRATGVVPQPQPTSQLNVDGGATLTSVAGMASATTPDVVGREFVRQYYTMMADSPHLVYKFYSNDSVYVFNGQEPVIGPHLVGQSIESLRIGECHTKIRTVDSHETFAKAVLVQVIGEISINAMPYRRFAQSFILAPKSERKYYVYNNIFRYLDGVFDDSIAETLKMQDGPKNLTVNGTLHEDELNNNQHMTPAPTYMQPQPLPPRSLGGASLQAVVATQSRLVAYATEPPPPTVPAPTPVVNMPPSSIGGGIAVSSAAELSSPSAADDQWTATPVQNMSTDSIASNMPPPSLNVAEPPATGVVADDRATPGDETAVGGASDVGVPSSWANKVAGRQPQKIQQPQISQSSSVGAFPSIDAGQSSSAAATRESPAPSSSSTTATPTTTTAPSLISNGGGGRPMTYGRGGPKPLNKELLARQIHVKYVPEDMLEKELFDAFNVFGVVSAGGVQIMHSKMRPNSSYAFVTFEVAASADKAVESMTVLLRDGTVELSVDHRRDDFRRLSSERSLDRGMGMPRGGIGVRGRGPFRGGRGGLGGGMGSSGRTFTPRGGGGTFGYYGGGGGSGYYNPAPFQPGDQQPLAPQQSPNVAPPTTPNNKP